jgi:ribonucleoside-diphosphate reductase alpha chain
MKKNKGLQPVEHYTREQVYEATLKYSKGDTLATDVWIDKYCLKQPITNTKDFIYFELTPEAMHRRLAKELARIEGKYPVPMTEDEIFNLLSGFNWIVPQGSPMAGIGNPFATTSISNCFVIGGHPDSYGGIFAADQEQAQLMKRRGGVGQDISYIRPSGAIAGTQPLGENAGMPLYMERFSNTTREVQQDGRRGALMLSVSIKHPDSEKFIDKKMTTGSVTGANVSVKIEDDFMDALVANKPYFQVFPIHLHIGEVVQSEHYELDSFEYDKLYTGKVVDGVETYFKMVDPTKIWNKITHNAWAAAEPGILFWSKIIKESPAAFYGSRWSEISTNPCGEIPLPAYDSCRLLLINLYSYISNKFTKDACFEDDLFIQHVDMAMRLMDDIVDLEIEKVDKIIEHIKQKTYSDNYQLVELQLWEKVRAMAVDGRRTGLGVTAEGDMMAALCIIYGTPEATKFSEALHQLLATTAFSASVDLAEEREHFPIWDPNDVEASGFLSRMLSLEENELMTQELIDKYYKFGRRNIGLLTIAPAGSVSILTQTSSGVEPIFSAWYFRKKKVTFEDHWDFVDEVGDKWVEFPVFHKPFIEWFAAQKEGIDFDTAKEFLTKQSKEVLDEIFKQSPYYKATAQDVDYVEKVRMQGAIQKWVDHSISVTVNMPESVTEEVVAAVYLEAHKSGCKGVTVYRDNSRGNVLSTTSVKDTATPSQFAYSSAPERPKAMECDIYHKTKSGEDFLILVGLLEDKPYEIFVIPIKEDYTKISKTIKKGTIHKVKKGRYDLTGENDMPLIEDITSFMIESERNSTRNFSAMLRHGVHPRFIIDMIEKYASISSFDKVVEKVLKCYIEEEVPNPCPKCQTEMINTEGCMKCPECGHAHCG